MQRRKIQFHHHNKSIRKIQDAKIRAYFFGVAVGTVHSAFHYQKACLLLRGRLEIRKQEAGVSLYVATLSRP
jgi:hypothetical protein